MTVFEAMNIVEEQGMQIERSRAIFGEAMHHFECKEQFDLLPHYADHIRLLLEAADQFLFYVLPELDKAVSGLHEIELAERGHPRLN
jgi:hypothetical protein